MIRNGKIIGDGMDDARYRTQTVKRGDPAFVMSRGALTKVAKNPLKWLRGKEEEGTPSTDWGSLLDCMLLDEANFDVRYTVLPETYPAGARHGKVKSGEINVGDPLPWNSSAAYCDDWEAVHVQGRDAVKAVDYQGCDEAVARLEEDEEIVTILANSRFQVMLTAEWHDPDSGIVVPLKALVDILPNDDCPFKESPESLIDLKTTKNADEDNWARDVGKYGYDVQGSLYLAIWNSIPDVKQRKFFKHILSENEHPYVVEKQSLTLDFLNRGKSIYEYALKTYCQCLSSGQWTGYKKRLVVNGWGQTEPTVWQMATSEP